MFNSLNKIRLILICIVMINSCVKFRFYLFISPPFNFCYICRLNWHKFSCFMHSSSAKKIVNRRLVYFSFILFYFFHSTHLLTCLLVASCHYLAASVKFSPAFGAPSTQAFSTPSCNYIKAEIFIATSRGTHTRTLKLTHTDTCACTLRAYN